MMEIKKTYTYEEIKELVEALNFLVSKDIECRNLGLLLVSNLTNYKSYTYHQAMVAPPENGYIDFAYFNYIKLVNSYSYASEVLNQLIELGFDIKYHDHHFTYEGRFK